MTIEEKRELYRDACSVARHLARSVMDIFTSMPKFADAMNDRQCDSMLPGAWDAMQVLGDFLNAHNAVEPDDDWTDAVYERMQRWNDSRGDAA